MVAELRRAARHYRAHRAELRAALADSNVKAVDKLRAPVAADSEILTRSTASDIASTAAVVIPLLSIGHGEAALAVGILRALKMASDLKLTGLQKLIRRITRSESGSSLTLATGVSPSRMRYCEFRSYGSCRIEKPPGTWG